MYAGVMAKEIDVFGFYFGENTFIDLIALLSTNGCGYLHKLLRFTASLLLQI